MTDKVALLEPFNLKNKTLDHILHIDLKTN